MTATVPSHKRCPRCRRVRPASAFYQRRGGRLSSYCQDCHQAASKVSDRRRRLIPAELERIRATNRTRMRRYRALHRQHPEGGDAA
jgi:recombinational DNA repair protein (RecF pathway)